MHKIKNRHFFFVYQPKKELGYSSRRFAVSKNNLEKYIGASNANKVLTEALELDQDSKRLKFRKQGIVDIYQR